MKKIPTILVPFNFSKTANRALEYAVSYVGKDANLKIVLAYISEDHNKDLLSEAFKSIERKYQRRLKHKIEWLATSGPLTESLVHIQKTEHIDLIIMGTFGTLGIEDEEPTNTSKLVLEVDCSVLVVPYGLEKFRMKHIALVLGKEEIDDTKVLGTLLNVARKFNAKVHVITIENKPESYGYSEADEKNENTMQYYLENFYFEHVFIENPDVVEGIMNYASDKEIDLITILPRNHTKNSEPSEGQLTQILTLHSEVPVLAID
ncbi:MAG: universal stress protein [Pricia sp.]|nr:universal stress protein [Pricia sp.]